MKRDNPAIQTSLNWPSIWQLLLSVLAIASLWSISIFLVLIGIGQFLLAEAPLTGAISMVMMATASMTAGLLLIPSAVFPLWRLLGKRGIPSIRTPRWLQPKLLILFFPLVLLLGYLVGLAPSLAWVIFPPLHVLAVGLPVLWLLYLAVRRLPLGSAQRSWGAFGSGLVLAPFLILILEGVALLVVILVASLVLISQPDLLRVFISISERLSTASLSQDEMLELLTPYLMRPAIIASTLAFGSVIVPLIEEFIKPVGVWLLAGRKMSPAAGFAAGALSGAGYAMFESMVLAGGIENWAQTVVMRIGTSAMHILTSGIMGWALTQAFHKGRYLRLGIAFSAAVAVHGLWNGLVITTTFAGLAMQLQGFPTSHNTLLTVQIASVSGLSLLVFGTFAAILWVNRKFSDVSQQRMKVEVSPENLIDNSYKESEQDQSGVL